MASFRWLLLVNLWILLAYVNLHVLNYDSVTVCDGVLKEIQCPSEENIHVLQGFYGKWRNHDCKGESVDPDNLPTCRQERSKTLGIVRDLCHGKNRCSLLADKSVYGEPCPDNKSYLYMTFFCMKNGQKLKHQKTGNNEEVVTVPSHGFIIREEKVHLEEDRRKKEREDAKRRELVKMKNPTLLNPNPNPVIPNGNRKSDFHRNQKTKNSNVSALEMVVKESAPIFSSIEDALKVENSLKTDETPTKIVEKKTSKKAVVKPKAKDTLSKQTNSSQENLLAKQKSMIFNYILKTGLPARKKTTEKGATGSKKTPKQSVKHTEEGAKKSLISSEKHKKVKQPIIKETSADLVMPAETMKDHIAKELEEDAQSHISNEHISSNKNNDTASAESQLTLGQMRSATICNGESKMIHCMPEEGIKIQDAFYGKRTGEDCHGKMSYRDDAPTCSALDARANVEEACNDKQSCLLTADENTYGKSLCPHVNKYLQLKYACAPLDDDVISKDTRPKHDGVELSPQLNEEEEAVSRTLQELARTNSTELLCNGEKKTISCQRDPGVAILSAFYGKQTGMDCRGINKTLTIVQCVVC
eukprot:TCONS_00064186-protein